MSSANATQAVPKCWETPEPLSTLYIIFKTCFAGFLISMMITIPHRSEKKMWSIIVTLRLPLSLTNVSYSLACYF